MTAVRIYNSSHVKIAELENAFSVGYDLFIDRLWTARFSLPFDDAKRAHCALLNFAEIYDGQKRIGLFRIICEDAQHDKRGKPVTYKCEHVLGSLNNDVIPGIVTRTGLSNALTYILSQQAVVSWQLGTNDLSGSYHYTWENRSLLFALLDLPTQQQADYQFTFDTTTYPWTVNIITPSATPQANVDYGRNLKFIKRKRDIGGLVTRLYAYGFGLPGTADEITIETANPTGEKYIESNTGTYGIVAKTWKDQRFTDATALYNAAVELLARLDEPKTTYTIDAMDVYQLIGVDELTLGDYIQITDSELSIDDQQRLVRLRKDDITKSPGGDTMMVLASKERQLSYGDAAYANDLDLIIGGAGYKPVVNTEKGYVQDLWSPTDSYPNIYVGGEVRGDEKTPRVEITDHISGTTDRTALLKGGELALKYIRADGGVRGKLYGYGSLVYNGTRHFGVLYLQGWDGGALLTGGTLGGYAQLIGKAASSPLVTTNIAWAELTAAPTNPRNGAIAYADGATWNPGGGEGPYMYYNGGWNPLARPLRGVYLRIADGTNANTLKCTVYNRWQGDTIAETDNIAKDATTGDFYLDVTGQWLWIEPTGLTGNCLYALGSLHSNFSGTDLMTSVYCASGAGLYSIRMFLRNRATGANVDITTLVDVGAIEINILYLTDG